VKRNPRLRSIPNIATVHEIGETDGVNFIAMEFIDGVTLREQIHRERTELRKLLRYLQHVAEGLAKAHAAGIVHRDLKPDNIMVTRDGPSPSTRRRAKSTELHGCWLRLATAMR
jgi:eukaryotic-like serine/threonine-protein kinase